MMLVRLLLHVDYVLSPNDVCEITKTVFVLLAPCVL